jgi:hypothetical protein
VGEPEDLAEAYLFLMRERFITGQIINVDGGTALAWRDRKMRSSLLGRLDECRELRQ